MPEKQEFLTHEKALELQHEYDRLLEQLKFEHEQVRRSNEQLRLTKDRAQTEQAKRDKATRDFLHRLDAQNHLHANHPVDGELASERERELLHDCELLLQRRKRLELLMQEQATFNRQMDKCNHYQYELMELLTILREKQAHYHPLLQYHPAEPKFNPTPTLKPIPGSGTEGHGGDSGA